MGQRPNPSCQWRHGLKLTRTINQGDCYHEINYSDYRSFEWLWSIGYALARAGHTVYASMRGTTGRNAERVKEMKKFAAENNVDLRVVELDVASQESADAAIRTIIAECGRLNMGPQRNVPSCGPSRLACAKVRRLIW